MSMRDICKFLDCNEYILYCPTCGELDRTHHGEQIYSKYCSKKHLCKLPFFGPMRHRTKHIKSDIKIGQDFPDDDIAPSNAWGFTLPMYEYMWEHYIDIPENQYFDRDSHEAFKKATIEFLTKGGYQPRPVSSTVHCPSCGSISISTQKKGFGVGKAAAGVVTVGVAGALAGGVGANKVFNICQNCGYRWEPGKR